NTAVHGKAKNKKTSLDIRMRVSPSTITVSLRDNGVPFNPAVYTDPNPGSVNAGGIALVHKMASKVEYVYQLGFNSTFLVFSREQLG
ncbi:MAG TPA: ATP-binding protein, partial [Clostridiaceae bacterium]|nr:ATP-binding protein [Clostridiaceae bacterium]